jgi:hypothetical protein
VDKPRIDPTSEAAIWAIAYSISASLLTLAVSHREIFTHTAHEEFASHVDSRAAALADKATKRLKGKINAR